MPRRVHAPHAAADLQPGSDDPADAREAARRRSVRRERVDHGERVEDLVRRLRALPRPYECLHVFTTRDGKPASTSPLTLFTTIQDLPLELPHRTPPVPCHSGE